MLYFAEPQVLEKLNKINFIRFTQSTLLLWLCQSDRVDANLTKSIWPKLKRTWKVHFTILVVFAYRWKVGYFLRHNYVNNTFVNPMHCMLNVHIFCKLHGLPKSSGHGVKALVVDCVTALATTGFVCRLLRGEVGAFTWFQDESSATSWTKSINVAATISWVIGTSSTAAKRISCCWILWISPLFREYFWLF